MKHLIPRPTEVLYWDDSGINLLTKADMSLDSLVFLKLIVSDFELTEHT